MRGGLTTAEFWMRDAIADIARKLRLWGARELARAHVIATLSYGGIFSDNSGGARPQTHCASLRRSQR
jgi:hypothetical protein